MILIEFDGIIDKNFIEKYSSKINYIDYNKYQNLDNWLVNFIEDVKKSNMIYDLTIIPYLQEVILCFKALNISFSLIYLNHNLLEVSKEFIEDYTFIDTYSECDKYKLNNGNEYISILHNQFNWIDLDEEIEKVEIIENEENENNLEDKEDTSMISNSKESKNLSLPENKNNLTMEQLLRDDIEITEADVRDLKATQNKLKVGMLLQAKNSLNRVLKLSNTLDKLYDKLLDRIDGSIDTTDTASLMYTTEYIAKSLSETNQFIMSLINNEKIQNFFIIDNSSVVNVTDNSRENINSREKIRKAAEIVLDNIDYFVQGDFQNLQNPNIIETDKENENAEN